jgi:solute:Na+ symporter, SSS family
MDGHLTLLDGLVLAVYFAGVLGLGCYFHVRSRTTEGFMAGGRSLPGWVCGLSILATYLSSISFVALPGRSYADNWNPLVFSLSLPIAVYLAARYFVPLYRRNQEVSAYSYLEKRFGLWARTYAGICYLLLQLARMGAVMYLVALPLSLLLGWDMRWVIVGLGLSVMVYTTVGGIVGVIWADALQAVVLTVGALVCLVVMIAGLPEGPGQLVSVAQAHHKFSLGDFGPSLGEATFWVVLVYGVVINLNNFGMDQGYIQRYITAGSDRAARRAVWLGGLLYLPVSGLFLLIGTALFVHYQVFPERLPDTLAAGANPDRVFPYFIVTALPAGFTGLLIAAVFAAAMSTVSTSLNSSATLLLTDFYRRYVRPAAGERESMRVLYGGTVVWGIGGTLMGLAMIGVKHALDAWWQLASIFSGGMLGLFLLGVVSQRVRNVAAFWAVATGVPVIAWLSLTPYFTGSLERWRSPFHGFLTIVIGTLVIFAVGMLITGWLRVRAPR